MKIIRKNISETLILSSLTVSVFFVFLKPALVLGISPVISQSIDQEAPIQIATPEAKASDSGQLRALRDRLASAVAEMRKKDQKVVAGDLKKFSGTTLELETVFGTVEKAQIDETLTKFYRIVGAATEEVKRSDAKEGQYVIVTGPHLDGVITANEVYIDEHFESRAGRVTEVNSTNFTFKLETFEKDTLNVSVERSATQEILNIKTMAIDVGGFTKTKEGDTAHIVYGVTSVKDQRTNVSPTRIFIIPATYFAK